MERVKVLWGLGVKGEGEDMAWIGAAGDDGCRGKSCVVVRGGVGEDGGGGRDRETPRGVDIELAQTCTGRAGGNNVFHEVGRDSNEAVRGSSGLRENDQRRSDGVDHVDEMDVAVAVRK
jgi:hypothetical protein